MIYRMKFPILKNGINRIRNEILMVLFLVSLIIPKRFKFIYYIICCKLTLSIKSLYLSLTTTADISAEFAISS